jgi:hypothetical protein
MATTTNYGWETPDDTDLVKDGAAAIRTLGSSIDTTLKAQIDLQIPDSIVDAKGDLITATADNTPARLAVGANDTVLTADSTTATGLKWATPSSGGMTSLATGTLSGASVDLTSISQAYNQLLLEISNPSTLTTSGALQIRINNITTSSYEYTTLEAGTATLTGATAQPSFQFRASVATGATKRYFQVYIPNYKASGTAKLFYFNQANESSGYADYGWGYIDTTGVNDPVTQITIASSGGNWDAGTYTLWGIK